MAKFDPDAFLGTTEPAEKKKKGFDPDAFLATPQPAARETAAQTFGRSAASAADSILNTITGTLDVPARALARAYYGGVQGMPLAQAEQRAVAETTSPKDVVGRAFGVTNTSGYQGAPLRQLGTALGETIGENVIQPVAQATGLPETYVGDVASMLPVPAAQPVARAAQATGRGVRAAAQVPVDVLKGAAGRATGYIAKPGETPTGYQVPSSRIPLGETFIPQQAMAELQRGMPISEGAIRPISELAPGPVLALSGGEIPVSGQAARAFGERVGETYSNPYTAAADIGSMFLTGGIPVITAGRGALGLAQAGADAYLGRKGFTSLTPEQRTILDQGGNPFYTQPAAGPVRPQPAVAAPAAQVTAQPVAPTDFPRLEYNPTQPVMYGSETGIVGRTPDEVMQADLAQRYAPQPVAPVAPNPMASQVTPEIQQATAQGLSQSDINKQNVMDMIRAKTGKPAVTAVAPTELPAAPVAQTVTPEITPSEQIMSAIPDMAKKSMPEIRFDIKNTGKGAITSKNNVIQLDKAAYDDLAAQHGVTLNWAELGELKKGASDAREQVNKFVESKIKEQRGPEKRGPQMRTLQKQAEAELGITGKEELTPEMRKRLGITETTKPAQAISPALQAMLDKQKAAGKYKPPGVSEMITDDIGIMSKAEWDQLNFQNTLAEKPTLEPYIDGNKLVTHEFEGVGPFEMVVRTEYDVETGKKLGPGKRISMKKVK